MENREDIKNSLNALQAKISSLSTQEAELSKRYLAEHPIQRGDIVCVVTHDFNARFLRVKGMKYQAVVKDSNYYESVQYDFCELSFPSTNPGACGDPVDIATDSIVSVILYAYIEDVPHLKMYKVSVCGKDREDVLMIVEHKGVDVLSKSIGDA